MLDIGILVILGLLAVRGWYRGLVRSVVSLSVLVIGAYVAFTMSGTLAGTVEGVSGLPHDPSRMVASVIMFLAISTAGAVTSAILHKGIRFLPGLTILNRLGGAVLAAVTGALAVLMLLTLVRLSSFNDSLDEPFADSEIVAAVTEADGVPQRLLTIVTGDRLPQALLAIQELVGDQRVVVAPGVNQRIPSGDVDDIESLPALAQIAVELVNRDRVGRNVPALAGSDALAAVAIEHAVALLAEGNVSYVSKDGSIEQRLDDANILRTEFQAAVVLAVSPYSAVEGLAEHAWSLPVVADADVTKIGVGVATTGVVQVYVVIVSR